MEAKCSGVSLAHGCDWVFWVGLFLSPTTFDIEHLFRMRREHLDARSESSVRIFFELSWKRAKETSKKEEGTWRMAVLTPSFSASAEGGFELTASL